MDELHTRLEELKQETIDRQEEVGLALEEGDRLRQIALGDQVEKIGQRYRGLLEAVPPAERDRVERDVGRRVTDLRRAAAQLTRRASGSAVAKAEDAGRPFVEYRTPGRSLEPARGPRPAGLAVGRDVEAYCSKCEGPREHRILAMTGDEPKQVLCLTCQTRHNYRTEPGLRRKPGATRDKRAAKTVMDVEAGRRREAQEALVKELGSAEDPRWFDPKGRYKAGEIIFHPDHGRGKIENVLRSSLLVRFRDGLRPLNLF